jgi:uncharacterized protein (TIGR03118 family)
MLCSGSALAMPEFAQTNLVSDIPGLAQFVDPDLVNAWGMSSSATSPIWVSDNGTGLATLYNGAGVKQALVVTIPPPAGATGPAAPDGQVFNAGGPGSAFNVTSGGVSGPSRFIFATEDGTISGWSPGVNATQAIIAVDNSGGGTGAVYKGLAIGTSGGVTRLYAANFRSGQVEVYDQAFNLIGTITDPSVPPGYAPFNVQVLNGQLYVTYALQDAAKHDDVAGAGNGFVDRFNLDGTGMVRLVSNGPLDSPWGLALAPSAFGSLGGDLLVGNFGDGTIDAFTLSGSFIGELTDTHGTPLAIDGLWGLLPGNGGAGGSSNALYFSAGPNSEADGLFGFLTVPEPASTVLLLTGLAGIIALRRPHRRREQPGMS